MTNPAPLHAPYVHEHRSSHMRLAGCKRHTRPVFVDRRNPMNGCVHSRRHGWISRERCDAHEAALGRGGAGCRARTLGAGGACARAADPVGRHESVQLHDPERRPRNQGARSGCRPVLRAVRQDKPEPDATRDRRLPLEGARPHRRGGRQVLLLPGGPLARLDCPVEPGHRPVRVRGPLFLQQGDWGRGRVDHRIHGRRPDLRPDVAARLPAWLRPLLRPRNRRRHHS